MALPPLSVHRVVDRRSLSVWQTIDAGASEIHTRNRGRRSTTRPARAGLERAGGPAIPALECPSARRRRTQSQSSTPAAPLDAAARLLAAMPAISDAPQARAGRQGRPAP